MAAFLIMLREGVEAALVVAILLAYLDRTNRSEAVRWVWMGAFIAVLASLGVGVVIWSTVGSLEGTAEQLTEGIVALVAASLLTWMVFWMGREARTIKDALESRADSALVTGGLMSLGALAFVAVLREGLESTLFLISTTVGENASGRQLLGGLIGIAAAITIGYLFYRGSHRIDLRRFFRVTGVLIVLFAAGLISKAVHEFQEVGMIPTLVDPVWTVHFLDPASSTIGLLLKSLFGWRTSPSLLTVGSYFAYLVPVGWRFLTMTTALEPETATAEPAAHRGTS